MLRNEDRSNAAPPRPRARRLASIVGVVVLGATAAYAYESCQGCSPYVPTQMPPDDPCYIGLWSVSPSAGSCAWDAPNCVAGNPCLISVTWTVVLKANAPSWCVEDGSFTWGAQWGTGGSSATGTAGYDQETTLSNLRVQCGSHFELAVTNGATQDSVMDLAVVCSSCSNG